MSIKISKTSLTKSFRGKSFSRVVKNSFKEEFKTNSDAELKRKVANFLGGKTESERGTQYKKIGIKTSDRKILEEIISPSVGDVKREPTLMEKRAMRVEMAKKKKRNIYQSSRSVEGQSDGGAVREESTKQFAGGGTVTTKSMVGGERSGSNTSTTSKISKKTMFTGSRNNTLNNKISSNKGLGGSSSRPLGF